MSIIYMESEYKRKKLSASAESFYSLRRRLIKLNLRRRK
jgi:hypothetical protein|tara:strand:- start:269 stop:385 length:117 start_codon:yes stop_codon:yes gene_type:complete